MKVCKFGFPVFSNSAETCIDADSVGGTQSTENDALGNKITFQNATRDQTNLQSPQYPAGDSTVVRAPSSLEMRPAR